MAAMGEWEDAEAGVRRRILQAQGRLMLMEVRFAAGAAGYEHSHVHEQISYCIAGRFEYSLDGRNQVLAEGRVDLRAEQCPARRESAGGRQPDRRVHAGARGFAGPSLSLRQGMPHRTVGNARPGRTRADARQLKPGVFVHNDRRSRLEGDPREAAPLQRAEGIRGWRRRLAPWMQLSRISARRPHART